MAAYTNTQVDELVDPLMAGFSVGQTTYMPDETEVVANPTTGVLWPPYHIQ